MVLNAKQLRPANDSTKDTETTPINEAMRWGSMWATTMPLSVGIESCSLKYFTDTKFVYRKIVELLVFAWTNIVTHLLQEFAFSQNLNVLMIFNFWSASHVYCTSWET